MDENTRNALGESITESDDIESEGHTRKDKTNNLIFQEVEEKKSEIKALDFLKVLELKKS